MTAVDPNIHVVLDLDATLVLAIDDDRSRRPVGSPRKQAGVSGKGRSPILVSAEADDYFDLPSLGLRVHLRPGLDHFLKEVFTHAATVSVWSAGSAEYVRAVAHNLEKRTGHSFYTVWSCEKCTKDDGGFPVKPLRTFINSKEGKAVGANLGNVILIDDLADNHQLQPKNVLMPEPYNAIDRYDFILYQTLYWLMHIITARKRGEIVMPSG